MTVNRVSARHRADRRPTTALDDIAAATTSQLAAVGRRAGVVAAASGMLVSAVAVPASAAPNGSTTLPAVDTSALTAQARTALATSPVVAAPAEAAWGFDAPAVEAVKPVVQETRRTAAAATASRSTRAVANNPAPASVSGNAVLEVAARYVGVAYRSGGSTPDSGFDCSGFVSYVYGQLGISLPHSSSSYPGIGTRVSAADAQPGDIIWTPGHVAIYAGDNLQIDAPSPGGTVQFRKMWQSNPMFIRVS